jgi:hypothetical protein
MGGFIFRLYLFTCSFLHLGERGFHFCAGQWFALATIPDQESYISPPIRHSEWMYPRKLNGSERLIIGVDYLEQNDWRTESAILYRVGIVF